MGADPTYEPNPVALPAVLFGLGEWSRSRWFPLLVQFVQWGAIHLTVVERRAFPQHPTGPELLEAGGILRYLTWDGESHLPGAESWRVAYVVTSADSHGPVIEYLLRHAPQLRVIVVEKPCCEDLQQAVRIFAACRRRGIVLIIADHYLLRQPVQYLLRHPDMLSSIGKPHKVVAVINEARVGGPQQGVIADLIVHLINLLLILFPGAQFTSDEAYKAQFDSGGGTGHETFAHAVGHLNFNDGSSARCELQAGKGVVRDEKAITLTGSRGSMRLDLLDSRLALELTAANSKEVNLSWRTQWSYAPLIMLSLSLIWGHVGRLDRV